MLPQAFCGTKGMYISLLLFLSQVCEMLWGPQGHPLSFCCVRMRPLPEDGDLQQQEWGLVKTMDVREQNSRETDYVRILRKRCHSYMHVIAAHNLPIHSGIQWSYMYLPSAIMRRGEVITQWAIVGDTG